MDLNEDFAIIQNSINKKFTTIIMCNCEINYFGRARSYLGEGDRMIIIKSDSCILVHKPKGRNPVNWMSSIPQITMNMEIDYFEIKAASVKPKEELLINIFEVYKIISYPLVDTEQLKLAGSEKDMSDMIYNNPSLISDDFKPLNREEKTEYGFLDVFGYDSKGNFVIIECKRYTAGLGAVTQLRRYIEKVKSSKGINKVIGIIAAPNISPRALKMLNDWGFEYKSINPPKNFKEESQNQIKINKYF
ncbi:MAG: endonuclease NucS [Candidatus Nanoarchaeia archaeon]|nr:endonuclease NucS [Candidatus Nanoarchaeia archaeon]